MTIAFVLLALGASAAPPAQPAPRPRTEPGPSRPGAVIVDVDAAAAGVPFARVIGGAADDLASGIAETSDSGFVLEGSNASVAGGSSKVWFFKLDAAGNKVWEKTLGSGSANNDFGGLTPVSGQGYTFNVASYDASSAAQLAFTVGKMDANGVILWQKKLQKGAEFPNSATPTSDGGFLVTDTGFQVVPPDLLFTMDLVRLNSSGTILWQKHFETTESLVGTPTILSDGKILIVGSHATAADPTNTDGWLRLLDANGNVVWDKYYGGPFADSFASATAANDGGYLIAGSTRSFGSGVGATNDTSTADIWLVKVGTNGAVALQKTFGGTADELGSVYSGGGTSYILSGQTKSVGVAGAGFLAKLTNSLGVTFAKTYDGPGQDSLFASADTDAGFLLQGQYDQGGRKDDILIVKTDSTGNPVWSRVYGGNEDDFGGAFRVGTAITTTGVAAAALAGEELFLSGSTRSFGAGGSDALAAKLDSLGQLAGCPLVQTVALTAATWAIPTTTSAATVTTNASPAVSTPAFTTANGTLAVTNVASTTADACTATPALSASAAADTTSGSAPLTVSFTGSASGGAGGYTYSWSFGDGSADSSEQNPSHVYADPGSFAVVLTVHDSVNATATDSHLTIAVTPGACSLLCTATVPAGGTAGQPVSFTSTFESANCVDPTTFSWEFGDSGSSTQQNASHTYAAAGTYDWTFTVSRGATTCSKNGSITVAGAAEPSVYWIPSAAHLPGALGSKWRSNIGAVNRSGATANLTLVFVPYSGGAAVTRTYDLADNATVEWADVLVSLFGFTDSANTKGTVKITSNVPIVALSRTYNQAPSGTFGQYYPSLVAEDAITNGQIAVLPLLKKSATFRTNAGFQNLGTGSCTGTIKLFNAAGTQVGTTRTLTAAADKYIQEDDIFTKAGAGSQEPAYAVVEVTTVGGRAWFFASVVDGITNDPTTVPQQFSVAGPYWVPSAAHLPGALGSKWRSNIGAVNRSGATANLTLVFVPYSGGANVTRTYDLADNATVEWADVLVSLFGFTDSANTKGTVKITSNVPIVALSRTFNQAASGTFGQYYPSLVEGDAITNGQPAVLPLLKKSASFRTNGAFQNLGTGSCTGTIKLFNAAGVQVGSTRTLTAAEGKYIQDDDIFTKAGAGNQEPAYAVVEVTTVGGKAWYFGSVIDGITNDPTTVPQQK